MNFDDMQLKIGNNMKVRYRLHQELLAKKISQIRKEIQIVFGFEGTYTMEESPAEWLSISYFNKLDYLLVSMENFVYLNDNFSSWLMLKYIYEFYIKIKYISSSESDLVFSTRVNDYLQLGVARYNFRENVENIEEDDDLIKMFKKDHGKTYRTMNSVAHPNVESLNMHKVSDTDDDRFKDLMLNTTFCFFMIYGVIDSLSSDERFALKIKPDLDKLKKLTGSY